jgi:FkbM family methyltransferase
VRRLKREIVRSILVRCGLEVHRSNVHSSRKLRYQEFFATLKVDLLIDVGANSGQFGRMCRELGYQGEILSFEPVGEAYAMLQSSAATDRRWTVAERMALGSETGEAEINVAGNSLSSSLLPMLESHLKSAPESKYVEKEKVPVRRLDDVLGTNVDGRRIFLKLDVQGYEPKVLAGASRVLANAVAVHLEMSLIPLYEGEMVMWEMCAAMEKKGFVLWNLEPGFRAGDTGRLLQVDGIFVRESALPGGGVR